MDMSKYIGLPYKNRGRSIDGVDCWGLVWLVEREVFGWELPSFADEYVDGTYIDDIKDLMSLNKFVVPSLSVDIPQTGDVALIKFGGKLCHSGVYIDGSILHTERRKDSVLERVSSLTRRARIEGYYRAN